MTHSFAVTVSNESEAQVRGFVESLREVWPLTPALVVLDGVVRPDLMSLFEDNALKVVLGREKLFALEHGLKWWHRLAVSWMRTVPTAVMIKVDPDTRFHRRWTSLPESLHFGVVCGVQSGVIQTQGGCRGMRAGLVEMLVMGGHLSRFRPPEGYAKMQEDEFLGIVLNRLGVMPRAWPEVWSSGAGPVPFEAMAAYAVTHPHKEL